MSNDFIIEQTKIALNALQNIINNTNDETLKLYSINLFNETSKIICLIDFHEQLNNCSQQ